MTGFVSKAVRLCRTLAWSEISPTEYQTAFREFGGSIELHPAAIALLERTSSHRARYFGLRGGERLLAAIPLWKGKARSSRRLDLVSELNPEIDLGQSELIIPIRAGEKIFFPFHARGISSVQAESITNASRSEGISFMLAKEHAIGPDRLNGKFLQKQRAQYRRFGEAGGSYQSVCDIPADTVARIYRELFRARWGRDPQGAASMGATLGALGSLLSGGVLWHGGNPIAIELFYRHPTPIGMLAVGVNGGVHPDFRHFSPGSILHFVNGMRLEEEATSMSLPVRFSFGHDDAPYKKLWCRASAAHET